MSLQSNNIHRRSHVFLHVNFRTQITEVEELAEINYTRESVLILTYAVPRENTRVTHCIRPPSFLLPEKQELYDRDLRWEGEKKGLGRHCNAVKQDQGPEIGSLGRSPEN